MPPLPARPWLADGVQRGPRGDLILPGHVVGHHLVAQVVQQARGGRAGQHHPGRRRSGRAAGRAGGVGRPGRRWVGRRPSAGRARGPREGGRGGALCVGPPAPFHSPPPPPGRARHSLRLSRPHPSALATEPHTPIPRIAAPPGPALRPAMRARSALLAAAAALAAASPVTPAPVAWEVQHLLVPGMWTAAGSLVGDPAARVRGAPPGLALERPAELSDEEVAGLGRLVEEGGRVVGGAGRWAGGAREQRLLARARLGHHSTPRPTPPSLPSHPLPSRLYRIRVLKPGAPPLAASAPARCVARAWRTWPSRCSLRSEAPPPGGWARCSARSNPRGTSERGCCWAAAASTF